MKKSIVSGCGALRLMALVVCERKVATQSWSGRLSGSGKFGTPRLSENSVV